MVRIAPDYIAEFALSMDRPDADAIFFSCGAMRTLDIVGKDRAAGRQAGDRQQPGDDLGHFAPRRDRRPHRGLRPAADASIEGGRMADIMARAERGHSARRDRRDLRDLARPHLPAGIPAGHHAKGGGARRGVRRQPHADPRACCSA